MVGQLVLWRWHLTAHVGDDPTSAELPAPAASLLFGKGAVASRMSRWQRRDSASANNTPAPRARDLQYYGLIKMHQDRVHQGDASPGPSRCSPEQH